MSNPDPREERIFEGALGLGAGERGPYLDRECGDDAELRRRVEGLLDALDRAGAFMRAPAAGAAGAGPQREQAGDRIGRYKLLQAIGEGGCGVVYMAEQQEPVRRRVALKVIKLGMDTRQVIARFEAERQALALMDHPNIARVLDAGTTDAGRPYFVMELVRGVRITEFCDDQRLSTTERVRLFIQVCHAIQHAHQKGVIHRDIKPSNILVSLDDGRPVPKVIDFGIAKATTGQPLTDRTLFTAFEQFLGTPAYMSPEQALVTSVDIDTRSDIYSLGVLLYELLTGHTPFDQKELLAAGLDGMRRTIREKQPPRPSVRLDTLGVKELTTTAERRRTEGPRLLHGVRGDLDWIVMKALEKDRARRYETATGLAADLGRHLNDEPVLARPPSRMYELRKTVRRHSLAVAAAVAVVLALAIGITLTTWQAVRATRAEQMQVRLRTDAEKSRQEAQAEAGRLLEFKKELSTADFLQAQRLLEEDNSNDALAYLAQSFYEDPENRAAATRLATLLAYRSWMVPVTSFAHADRVHWAEYSPDGRRIVTGSEDGTAQVWDTDTGKPVGEALRHPYGVTQARFSPDGQRVVTASEDATVRVWDLKTGQVMNRPLRHGSPVTSLHFSPDGGRLVTGTATNTTRVWDLATGRSLARWQGQEGRKVRVPDPRTEEHTSVDKKAMVVLSRTVEVRAEFSPEGNRVVTGAEDGTARVWDVGTGQPVGEVMEHESAVTAARFSLDGQRVVTVTREGKAQLWDPGTGKPEGRPITYGDGVLDAHFTDDGQQLVTVARDHTARAWDPHTGEEQAGAVIHGRPVGAVQFSPDGRRWVEITPSHAARVWDLVMGEPVSEPFRDAGDLLLAAFGPDGQSILTTSSSSLAHLWKPATTPAWPSVLAAPPPNYAGNIAWVQPHFSPDGQRVLRISAEHTARIWDANTGVELVRLNHETNVQWCEFSVDGRKVITRTSEGDLRVWDAVTGRPLSPALKADPSFRQELSPDGEHVLRLTSDATATMWDTATGRLVLGPIEGWGHFAQFSRDGRRVISVMDTPNNRMASRIYLWDAKTGVKLAQLEEPGERSSAYFLQDPKRIVTLNHEAVIRVWDAESGRQLGNPIRLGVSLHSHAFSSDGLRVLGLPTGSAESTVPLQIWDATTGRLVSSAIPLERFHTQLPRFSQDNQTVITLSRERVNLWDPVTGTSVADPFRVRYRARAERFRVFSRVVFDTTSNSRRLVTVEDNVELPSDYRYATLLWDIAPNGSAYPAWVRPLAEALSGRLLNRERMLKPVPFDRVEKLSEVHRSLASAAEDDWTVWGRWLLAPPDTRTVSPFSRTTIPEEAARRIDQNTLASLREVTRRQPTNSVAFARLALLEQKTPPVPNPQALRDAEFHGRWALRCNPRESLAWQFLGSFQGMQGLATKAIEAIDRALELDPNNQGAWLEKGYILENLGRPQEALAAYEHRLTLLPRTDQKLARDRKTPLLARARMLLRLDRREEASQTAAEACDLARREDGIDRRHVDLSPYYNAGLRENWWYPDDLGDLSELGAGVRKLGETPFELRGVVQLRRRTRVNPRFPDAVVGIPVGSRCHRVAFLQGAHLIGDDGGPSCTTIGYYIFHYADATVVEHPIQAGIDVASWLTGSVEPSGDAGPGPKVVWIGESEGSRAHHHRVQLCELTWENPKPEIPITSIDFLSAAADSTPFLVAITLE